MIQFERLLGAYVPRSLCGVSVILSLYSRSSRVALISDESHLLLQGYGRGDTASASLSQTQRLPELILYEQVCHGPLSFIMSFSFQWLKSKLIHRPQRSGCTFRNNCVYKPTNIEWSIPHSGSGMAVWNSSKFQRGRFSAP
jgi:hypothetical protein